MDEFEVDDLIDKEYLKENELVVRGEINKIITRIIINIIIKIKDASANAPVIPSKTICKVDILFPL